MIEDDVFLTELLAGQLEKVGCIPYRAPNAKSGIEQARQFQPAVIILDLMLPGMSGEDAIKVLKGDPELKHIPVVVFSNKDAASDIENLMQLGAAKYYIKSSTDIKEFVETVKEFGSK